MQYFLDKNKWANVEVYAPIRMLCYVFGSLILANVWHKDNMYKNTCFLLALSSYFIIGTYTALLIIYRSIITEHYEYCIIYTITIHSTYVCCKI